MIEWEARYAEAEYAYGTEPNGFVQAMVDAIPAGPVLCLAEGQGRNAVFLAQCGHAVVAVDQSPTGLARATALASHRGVTIATVVADLVDYQIEAGAWAGVVMIFAHLPPALRADVHRRVVEGLRPGGAYVLEAYTPAQLAFGTGGPKDPEVLMTLERLRVELAPLTLEVGREIEREVNEGAYHHGRAAVVQVLARKRPG